MGLSSDANQHSGKVASRGKVLKFPVTPATTRRSWPGVRKYGLAAAVTAVLVIGGILAGLWTLGGKSTTQYNAAPVARGSDVVTDDVLVGVIDDDLALVPGMIAATQIVIDQRNNMTRVPDRALRYAPGALSGVAATAPPAGQARVWVLRDGTPVAISVVSGLDDGNYTEIVKGDFQPGDRVITAESNGQASGQSDLPVPRP